MTLEIDVGDPSAPGDVRRRAVELARSLGWNETDCGRLALVATELTSNVVKHAGRGRVLVARGDTTIDLLTLDNGPGIANLAVSLRDGHSTAGTSGNGLGAVRRIAQQFDAVSWPGRGLVAMARVGVSGTPAPHDRHAAIVMPKPGETVSGDGWSVRDDDPATHRSVFVVDGLGHGTDAAIAAREAVAQFERSHAQPPVDILRAVHEGIRHTRGGAVAVARIGWGERNVSYAGLGNIGATLVSRALPGSRRLVSHNGTAGHVARKFQAFDYPFADGLLVMHSDGLSTGWSVDAYPGLANAHPLLVAATLYRDHSRRRDDTCIVVCRLTPP